VVNLISADERRQLLQLARRALEARVRREPPPVIERGGALDSHAAAFVTVYVGGELRGCLGRLEPDRRLAETIVHLAEVVSDSDPRFAPVMRDELTDMALEISVLTAERRVAAIDEIEIGRHGVIVEQGSRRGLLLPQVAPEHGWDRETLLAHAARKAALPPDVWQQGASVYVFEAEVFGERVPPENV
jgi:AmmeMemoRadiSam system protein A